MTRLQRGMTALLTVLLSLSSHIPIVAQTNPGKTTPKTTAKKDSVSKRKPSTLPQSPTLSGSRDSQDIEDFAIPIVSIDPISPAQPVSEAHIGPGFYLRYRAQHPELFPPEKPETPPQSSPEDNP